MAKGALVNDYTIPGTESQHGIDTLDERFPQASGTTGQLVFESTSGPITDHQAPIEDQIKAIEKVKHVSSVDDPFASGAVGTISTDKKFAQSQIQFDTSVTDLQPDHDRRGREGGQDSRPAPATPPRSAATCTPPPGREWG